MNRVILLGRMARDPEVRYTQVVEPFAVCRFVVAVDRPFSKNRQEGEATADFINCVAFRRTAENINQYFRKGNRIAVQGRLQVRKYTDQQGNNKYSTDVIVEDFEFVESKSNGNGAVTSEFSIDSDAEDEALPWQG